MTAQNQYSTDASTSTDRGKIDAETLNSLPSLDLKAKYLVSGFMNGIHKSPFSGSGSEFKEYLEYRPGDDLKHIDWKIFAKTDQLYIKKRVDERNLTCTVFIDASASMNYPPNGRFCDKWTFACTICAAMNILLMRQKDALSLCILDGLDNSFSMPSTQTGAFFRNIERMNAVTPDASMNFTESLAEAAGKIRKSETVMIISDFYCDTADLKETLDKFRSEHSDIILVRVLSPHERDLDFDVPQMLKDSESGERLNVRADLIRDEYKKRLAAHSSALADEAGARGGDFLCVYTDEPPLDAIFAYFAMRNSKGSQKESLK